MIAALYVETAGGCYAGLRDVDAWDESRDARLYNGPHPVVAHPPCQRWGRFWHGSPRKPHQFEKGADDGYFAAALAAVRLWGGVLEHPADSLAWRHHGLTPPPRTGGWHAADFDGGWTCYVEQGFYGHAARKGRYGSMPMVSICRLLGGVRGSSALIPRWSNATATNTRVARACLT